jgi:hypothetical protein
MYNWLSGLLQNMGRTNQIEVSTFMCAKSEVQNKKEMCAHHTKTKTKQKKMFFHPKDT